MLNRCIWMYFITYISCIHSVYYSTLLVTDVRRITVCFWSSRWAKQVCCGIRCSNNWYASLHFSMETAPLEIMGYDRAIHTHHPALNPLGPITSCWWQAASQSTAVAARLLVCTLLPWWFSDFVRRHEACFSSQPGKDTSLTYNVEYCNVEKVKHLKELCIFIRWRGGFAAEADRELIGERLGRNLLLSADQCNEGPLKITPGLSPPISSKTM